jgi:multimeric flavodoxin WrbA
MQKGIISVIYHSNHGHTEQAARTLAAALEADNTVVYLIHVSRANESWDLLHASDTIVFGCPTYFGNVSAGFKEFMEATGGFWYKQAWKNKWAAGFTVSSSTGGDKLNTLQALAVFAAQHSMHWLSLGVLPRYINDEQTDGQNRLASYLGLMIQSDNSHQRVDAFHPGDLLTIELFAERIRTVTLQSKNSWQESAVALSN